MPAPVSVPRPPTPATSFDLKRLYHTLIERSWLVVTVLILAVLLTAAYIQRQPVLYAANAVVQIEQEEARVVKVEKFQAEDLRWMDALRTIEQTLKSRAVLERVVESLKLAQNPSFYSASSEPTKEQLTSMLDRMVSVRLRKGTRLLDVMVTHPNPELAAKIANAVVTEFVAQGYEQSSAVSEEATSFLSKESRRLKLRTEEAESALQAFRDRTKSVSLEERNDIVTARLRELNAKLTEANSAVLRLRAELAQVEKLGTNVEALLVLPAIMGDLSVAQARGALSKLDSDFASLKGRYKYAHPKYIQMEKEIDTWRTALTNAVLKVPQSFRSAYESATASEKALQEELARQEETSRQLTKDLTEYQRLARDVEGNRSLYDAVQQRLKEAALTRELKPSKVQLNTRATAPSLPFSPNKKELMIRGVVAGLILGVLLALGLNALDSSIKTVDDAEDYLHLPVLSPVPKTPTGDSVLIVNNDAKAPGAEAFRTLRTSMSMLGRPEDRRTYLFTSALPQEGKTFCSLNFSLCLAQQGLKTLVIDGDLRRPAIEKSLVPNGPRRPGVTDYLTGQKKFDELIQQHGHEKFFYLPAGTLAPNPAELLAQGNFDELIKESLLHFDRVVVDSAPIHAVSDTLLMMHEVKTVCLVVRSGKTPRKAVGRAVELLYKAEAPLAGIILNRQARRRFTGGYDPYYSYSYDGKYSEKGVYGAK
jgi:succinoglycan biosynthesis transport protein ExoP